ncbi:MAG: D-ribose pyranase [Caldilineaceae bacterium]|nr:D-ribose pyranase [Caldilineaceae bacterium]
MKKQGILNAEIAAVVASMGHLDTITVADAGLPIPAGPHRIDLVVKPNLPRFLDVLNAVLDELIVQEAIIALEMPQVSPQLYNELRGVFGEIPVRMLPHTEFKPQTALSKAVIRTGEFTPYANVILVAGVAF